MLGQDERPILASDNLQLLANRLVWATSCYSADVLAPAVGLGATVVGYSGKVYLARQEPYRTAVGSCVLAGAEELLKGSTVEVAFLRTQGAFGQEARRLSQGTFDDQIIAVWVFDSNARATRLLGAGNRWL